MTATASGVLGDASFTLGHDLRLMRVLSELVMAHGSYALTLHWVVDCSWSRELPNFDTGLVTPTTLGIKAFGIRLGCRPIIIGSRNPRSI